MQPTLVSASRPPWLPSPSCWARNQRPMQRSMPRSWLQMSLLAAPQQVCLPLQRRPARGLRLRPPVWPPANWSQSRPPHVSQPHRSFQQLLLKSDFVATAGATQLATQPAEAGLPCSAAEAASEVQQPAPAAMADEDSDGGAHQIFAICCSCLQAFNLSAELAAQLLESQSNERASHHFCRLQWRHGL